MKDQFDVCRNIGPGRSGFPYFIVMRAREFGHTGRRVVIPMTHDLSAYPPVAPRFTIEGRELVANALLIASLPIERIGPVVASLADDASQVALIGAIDRVISRA